MRAPKNWGPGCCSTPSTPLNAALNYWTVLGYQRELNYRRGDGSYSAWGESDDEGSLWLTAFVVRSFARAQPFIFIDPTHLSASLDWIRDQQLENGCFRPVRRFDKLPVTQLQCNLYFMQFDSLYGIVFRFRPHRSVS